jgi:Uri superfamily endonuclease
MTREPGTYVLVLESSQRAQVTVGTLGRIQLEAGFYLYVGSALGPGGLAARVGRHARKSKQLHWHIDYVRAHCQLTEVWMTRDARPWEHAWAGALARMPGVTLPMPRFGASDCRCPTHLFGFVSRPEVDDFQRRLGPIPGRTNIETIKGGPLMK